MTLSVTRKEDLSETGEDRVDFCWSPDPTAPDPIWIPILSVRLASCRGFGRNRLLIDCCSDIRVLRGELTDSDGTVPPFTQHTKRNRLRDIVIGEALQEDRRRIDRVLEQNVKPA